MSPRRLSEEEQQAVRLRANFLCEYCHTSEQWQYVPFTIDHVVPVFQGGSDEPDNLALACFHCNRQKSDRTQAVDPETAESVDLFNPRQERWSVHFVWSADRLQLMGRTPIGRATVAALKLNRERIIPLRAADLAVHHHPPPGDPVLAHEE